MRRQSPKLARYRARHQAARFNRLYQPQFFWYTSPSVEKIMALFAPEIEQFEAKWGSSYDRQVLRKW